MFAFDEAHKYGATGFETDLRLSKDGVIVLPHDDNLKRLGLPDKTVSNLSSEEICSLEIPSPDGKYRDKMITLEMLLKKYLDKNYIFDCKISDENLFKKLKALLEKLKFHSNTWFLTWNQRGDDLVEKVFPGNKFFPRMGPSYKWGLLSVIGLGIRFEPRNDILSLPAYFRGLPLFGRSQIESIHERGKKFLGYLVNRRKDFLRCKACGVETILTDRTDLISAFLRN